MLCLSLALELDSADRFDAMRQPEARAVADPLDAVQAFRALAPGSLSIAGVSVAVVLLYLVVPLGAPTRQLMGNTLLTVLPLFGAVACALAASRAARSARLPWTLFMAAAGIATAAQLAWIVEQWASPALAGFPRPSLVVFPLFHPVFMAGALLALRWDRLREVATDVALDGVLVVLAGIVVVLRIGVEPLLGAGTVGSGQLTVIVLVQVLAVGSVVAATLLLVWHSPALSPQATTGLFLSALVFAVANVASAAGVDPHPAIPGDAFDLVWLTGWALFMWAGMAGAKLAVLPTTTGEGRMAPVVRSAVVPGITLFLALAVIDVALNPTVQPSTVLLVALLGAVLALRVGKALTAAEQHSREERRYTQAQVLIQISHSLAGATHLDEVLDLISVSARQVLDARATGIELLTPDGLTLEAKTALGLPPDVVGMKFPVDGSFTGWVVRHGTPRATVDASADPYIQEKSLRFLGQSPVAAAPLRFGPRTFGALYAIRDRAFDGEELELLEALAEQAATAVENARLFEQVTALSLTDPLTGLANRRQLERDVAREFAAARRGRGLVAVMFDLDGFKDYNDRFGHMAGDEALRTFAEALKVETRAMNLAARYGGDEFLTLLSDADEAAARIFIQRVAERFRRESAGLGRGSLDVTAGAAAYDSAMEDWLELIEAADRALYRGKTARSRT